MVEYRIRKTDSADNDPFIIAEETVNTQTSLALPGFGVSLYGRYINENLVHLLENFSDDAAPAGPLRGQLWYNKTADRIQVYSGIGVGTPKWNALLHAHHGLAEIGEQGEPARATARTNLGLGTAATRNTGAANGSIPLWEQLGTSRGYDVGTAAGQLPTNAHLQTNYLVKTLNLTDVPDKAAARTALGLGTAAVRNTGRIDGAIPLWEDLKTSKNYDVGYNQDQIPTNQHLNGLYLVRTNSLSELVPYRATAWANLGIKPIAGYDIGNAMGQIPRRDDLGDAAMMPVETFAGALVSNASIGTAARQNTGNTTGYIPFWEQIVAAFVGNSRIGTGPTQVPTNSMIGLNASGTTMVFVQPTAPTGWTQNTALNDRVLRVVSGQGGAVGGNWTPTGTTSGHALTLSEIPGHTHFLATNFMSGTDLTANPTWSMASSADPGDYRLAGHNAAATLGASSSTGGNANFNGAADAHSHSLGLDSSWRPSYVDSIICVKT